MPAHEHVIRPAVARDLVAVSALHRASIRALCAATYSGAQIEAWIACLSLDAYAALLSTRRMIVCEADGALAGFGVHDVALGFIHATYVHPDRIGLRIGTELLRDMEANTPDARTLTLHATLNAIRFYEAHGFVRGESLQNRLPSGVDLPCVMLSKPLQL